MSRFDQLFSRQGWTLTSNVARRKPELRLSLYLTEVVKRVEINSLFSCLAIFLNKGWWNIVWILCVCAASWLFHHVRLFVLVFLPHLRALAGTDKISHSRTLLSLVGVHIRLREQESVLVLTCVGANSRRWASSCLPIELDRVFFGFLFGFQLFSHIKSLRWPMFAGYF